MSCSRFRERSTIELPSAWTELALLHDRRSLSGGNLARLVRSILAPKVVLAFSLLANQNIVSEQNEHHQQLTANVLDDKEEVSKSAVG